LTTYTILVADDTEENLKLITEYLEADARTVKIKWNFFWLSNFACPNGEIAFKIAQRAKRIDLLLPIGKCPKWTAD
jgi:CheY-like chemotaxis protein